MKRGPLVSESTALPTEPQPLPTFTQTISNMHSTLSNMHKDDIAHTDTYKDYQTYTKTLSNMHSTLSNMLTDDITHTDTYKDNQTYTQTLSNMHSTLSNIQTHTFRCEQHTNGRYKTCKQTFFLFRGSRYSQVDDKTLRPSQAENKTWNIHTHSSRRCYKTFLRNNLLHDENDEQLYEQPSLTKIYF